MDVRLLAALISLGIPFPAPDPPGAGEKHPPLEPYWDSGPRRSPRHPGELEYLYQGRLGLGSAQKRRGLRLE
jgi:hypothetical protein